MAYLARVLAFVSEITLVFFVSLGSNVLPFHSDHPVHDMLARGLVDIIGPVET